MKIKYLGRTPKTVELPIPFEFKSEQKGKVICDPVGEFTEEDGQKLLEIGGLWVLAESESVKTKPSPVVPVVNDTVPSVDTSKEMPLCACGCGTRIVWKNIHKTTGIPKYIQYHRARMKRKPQVEKEAI